MGLGCQHLFGGQNLTHNGICFSGAICCHCSVPVQVNGIFPQGFHTFYSICWKNSSPILHNFLFGSEFQISESNLTTLPTLLPVCFYMTLTTI
jgi:hypothetical protein